MCVLEKYHEPKSLDRYWKVYRGYHYEATAILGVILEKAARNWISSKVNASSYRLLSYKDNGRRRNKEFDVISGTRTNPEIFFEIKTACSKKRAKKSGRAQINKIKNRILQKW